MRTTRSAVEGSRRGRQIESRIVSEIVRLRLDSGASQRAVAREADLSPASLCRFEAGSLHPPVVWLARVATALGADLSVGIYPNTGPRIHDRWQARMVEALLSSTGPGWRAYPETPLVAPVRGVIDVVLVNPSDRVVVAIEAESELRRVEQELRWAGEKADALPSSAWWRHSGAARMGIECVGRVMLLRASATNRAIVRELAHTFDAVYPADPAAVVDALAGRRRWPGDGLVWVTFQGPAARLSRRRLA